MSIANDSGSLTFWLDLFKPGRLPITKVEFNGFAGNDRFYNMTGIASVAPGYSANNILAGGSNNDIMHGDGDLDVRNGGAGSDYFRFEEQGALSSLELALSDFAGGIDKKP